VFADAVIAATLFGIIGAALGYITRSTVAAIVGAVGWVLFAEYAILRTHAPHLARWLVTGSAVTLTSPAGPGEATLIPITAVAVLSGYTVLLLAVASRLVLRRDVA
jgi:ABC-2 type transport system permease protein